MRRLLLTLLAVTLVAGLILAVAGVGGAGNGRSHSAQLTGGAEVPPVDTEATGKATFQAIKNGTVLNFQVRVKNIENVTQAHIHQGAAGANGPVVAFLFGPNGDFSGNGSLAKGKLTDADLLGPLAGMTIADLVAEIEAGNAYVNVHTDGTPSGEIRGQIG